MVSRPPNDRQTLDLQNAESCTGWILSFVANCRAEKKEDKINIDGTIVDLQVTNLFLSICGQDALLKLRSLMSPKKLLDTPFKEIRLAIRNYISPKERVVTAERAKFLSVVQGVGESDDDFLTHLREEARYCYFEKLKTVANREEELVKIKFISGLRDPEAKLRLLDGIKTKPTMSLSRMTESLQFRSQAMGFASSSTGNRPFVIKEEVVYNFKKNFRKPSEKFTGNKGNGNLCNRCGGKPHSSKPCPALNKKCNTCEKVGHFSKMCKSKTQPKSGKSDQQNNFCEEEGKLPGQTSSEMEMGMYYTRENVFNMSVRWEYITVKDHKIKMQVDTGADSTVISSLIWTELGKPQLNGKVRRLEAYDGHQLTLLRSLTCDVEWNGSNFRQQQLAVVQSDKKFGLLGRDILPQESINAVSDERLPAVKGYKAHVKLIPGSQPKFCKARKIPLPLQDRVKEKLETMVRQGILEPVQPVGVTNASPVVWQRKKNGALRLCVDLKVHINGKVMDDGYPIPDMETIFHNLHGASYFGKIDLSDAYYQIELDEDAKEICTINTSQGLFKMCRLPQGLKNSSSIFQNCIESTLKGIKGVVIFQDDVLLYGTTKDQYEKRMLAVKSRQREKNFTINEKKSNSKPVSSVSFLGYSVSKEGIAPNPKHVEKIKNAKPPSNMKQLESFVGLANFYVRMIPDFATKMLPLNEIRKEEFRMGQERAKCF